MESFSTTSSKSHSKCHNEHLLDVIADNTIKVEIPSLIPADILRQLPKVKTPLKEVDFKVVELLNKEIEVQDNKLKQLPKFVSRFANSVQNSVYYTICHVGS